VSRSCVSFAACAALVAASILGTASAVHASHGVPPIQPGTPRTVADNLLTPLSLEVDRQGIAYLSQDLAGALTKITRDGTTTTIAAAVGQSISAVSFRRGTIYFAQTAPDHNSSILMAMRGDEEPVRLADIGAYEATANPDQGNTYGFSDLPESCADQFDISTMSSLPPTYSGLIDTNPHASLALSQSIFVADAGANAVLRIGYDGDVSVAAVLPAVDPVAATEELIARFGFPRCAIGHDYRFEPVPTDVELGPDGWLYVTSMPGGPVDSGAGAPGSLYKVNPHNGLVVEVDTGFLGATGLAVSMRSGAVAVSELFGGPDGAGQISLLSGDASTRRTYTELDHPIAIELRRNKLYVTTDTGILDPQTGAPRPVGELAVLPLEVDRGQLEDSSDNGS
jgi:hypothetical protein